MLWVKALHIIFVVCWFAALFYLPRLMVYHTENSNQSNITERFKIMEKRLYYGIMWPAAILTTLFGIWLLTFNFAGYMTMGWLHTKLVLVILLWIFHFYCGHCLKQLRQDKNRHSAKFFRILNEVPTFLLIGIVILVVVKP